MAFTQEQYDALIAAIALGAKKYKYGDEEVEYNSLQDMLAVKELMEADLGLSEPIVRVFGQTDRGLRGCKKE